MDDETQPKAATIEDETATPKTTWRAQGRYWVLGVAALLAGAALLTELRDGFSWAVLLFSAIALLGGVWALWMATTRVELMVDGVHVHRLIGSQEVAYPQLISVTSQGRLFNVLTILYYPRRADGIVDNDAVRSLLIPSVQDQIELLEALEAKVQP